MLLFLPHEDGSSMLLGYPNADAMLLNMDCPGVVTGSSELGHAFNILDILKLLAHLHYGVPY